MITIQPKYVIAKKLSKPVLCPQIIPDYWALRFCSAQCHDFTPSFTNFQKPERLISSLELFVRNAITLPSLLLFSLLDPQPIG